MAMSVDADAPPGAWHLVSVTEASQVGEARRRATALAMRAGLDEPAIGRAALVATELGTNLVRHAGGGEVALGMLSDGAPGVAMLALDRGRGMANVAECLRDGYSTAGGVGTGLGAIARQSDLFDVYSRPDGGTALLAHVTAANTRAAARGPLSVGGVCVPHPLERISGDGWLVCRRADRTLVVVADGLGHGAAAAEAAVTAVGIVRDTPALPLIETLGRVHQALRSTRGAAVALASIEPARRVVRFVGVGNISGVILGGEGVRHVVSHNGTLGQERPRMQEFVYPWPERAVLVLHSDGVATHWDLTAYPGLLSRHPTLVAGVLYRDFSRRRDDACVVVIREGRR